MSSTSPPRLFDELPATASPGYRNLRDPPSENAQLCRTYCESLWDRFWPYADAGFVQDFPVHLHQRFWEMYLSGTARCGPCDRRAEARTRFWPYAVRKKDLGR